MKIDSKFLTVAIPEIPFGSVEPNKELANRMMEFMRRKKGLGLAANQVGYLYRLFVMDINVPRRCFNPRIIQSFDVVNKNYYEGCLSYPGKKLLKPRSIFIAVEYTDQNKKKVTDMLHGLEAICYQHELDHLNGIVWDE